MMPSMHLKIIWGHCLQTGKKLYSLMKCLGNILERLGLFRMATKTSKALVITFVTTYGVVDGKHKSIVHSEVTMDNLF